MRVVLLGPPGSGKGTVAEKIKELYGLVHISTGDLFRNCIRQNTPIGQEAKVFIDRGDLVPDELTVRMLAERLDNDDCADGFLLDGFPRTLDQADALEALMNKNGFSLDVALNVSVPDRMIMERLSGRRVCPECGATYNIYSQPSLEPGICDVCQSELTQRPDDKDATIRHRLDTYAVRTAPLLDYYEQQGILRSIDNSGDLAATFAQLKEVLPQ